VTPVETTEARSEILKFWRGFCMACEWRDAGHPTVELAQSAADAHLRERGSDWRHTHGPPRRLAVAIEDFVPMVLVPEWMPE
jgi:hypothetical protein